MKKDFNRIGATLCSSMRPRSSTTSWLNKFKLLALVLTTMLSVNVWGADVTYTFSSAANNPGNSNDWFSDDIDSYTSWSATKGGSNNPKYYSTGSGLRVYNGGTFSISSSKTIASITLTFSGDGYTFSSSNTTNPQTVNPNATSYEWEVSRTCRLQKVEITYASSGPATHYTVSFYNNGVKVGEATTETYDGDEYLNEEDLPDMSSASFPHPTSTTFAGWTTDEITTPATSIDYHHFIDQNTAITEDCSVNALWGTTTGGSTATFNANDASNLSETSGSGYHQWADKSTGIAMGGDDALHYTSGSPKTFTIKSASDVWNTVYFDGDDKVIAQYVVTASSTDYGISGPGHGDISSSGAVYTVTNVNANYTYAYTNHSTKKDQQIRITNAVVTCYTGYITHYTACTPGTALSITSANTVTTGKTLSLTSTGGNGGTVTWSVTNGTGTATVAGSTLTAGNVGTVTVKAHQNQNGQTCETNAEQTVTINSITYTDLFLELKIAQFLPYF